MGFLVSFLLGFVPSLLFAAFVYWLDRYEKEPKLLLGVVFMWGAIVAAGAAFLINTTFGVGVFLITGSQTASEFATGSLVAPVVEEIAKGLAVLLVFLIWRCEFDSILDGIIYAAIVALGFAATENVYYIYNYGYLQGGWQGILSLFFIRVILVGWQHPFYTSFFGIGLAMARLSRRGWVKFLAPLLGISVGMTAHSIHNTISPIVVGATGSMGWVLNAIFDWSGWLAMFGFLIWMVLRERKLAINYLKEEIDLGNMTQQQYRKAYSLFGRYGSYLRALFKGGYKATSRFYSLSGELIHKKNQLACLGDEGGNLAAIEKLRSEMHQLSPSALS
jgi:RsiW-degrading membrane proteinase PrsW (M82 family)